MDTNYRFGDLGLEYDFAGVSVNTIYQESYYANNLIQRDLEELEEQATSLHTGTEKEKIFTKKFIEDNLKRLRLMYMSKGYSENEISEYVKIYSENFHNIQNKEDLKSLDYIDIYSFLIAMEKRTPSYALDYVNVYRDCFEYLLGISDKDEFIIKVSGNRNSCDNYDFFKENYNSYYKKKIARLYTKIFTERYGDFMSNIEASNIAIEYVNLYLSLLSEFPSMKEEKFLSLANATILNRLTGDLAVRYKRAYLEYVNLGKSDFKSNIYAKNICQGRTKEFASMYAENYAIEENKGRSREEIDVYFTFIDLYGIESFNEEIFQEFKNKVFQNYTLEEINFYMSIRQEKDAKKENAEKLLQAYRYLRGRYGYDNDEAILCIEIIKKTGDEGYALRAINNFRIYLMKGYSKNIILACNDIYDRFFDDVEGEIKLNRYADLKRIEDLYKSIKRMPI